MTSWQTLTKLVTQGMCLRLKTAIGRGRTVQKLIKLIEVEEARDPSQPPEEACSSTLSTTRDAHFIEDVVSTPVNELRKHGQGLCNRANRCMLCGQWLIQASRIKSPWRASHPDTWRLCHNHAHSEAQSLKALFEVPCRFCASKAKNASTHAPQCSVMFQVLSLRWLPSRNIDWKTLQGCKLARRRAKNRRTSL